MMHSQGMYRIDDASGCNVEDASKYLVVNCVGMVSLNSPFQTSVPDGRHDFYLMYMLRGELIMDDEAAFHTFLPGEVHIYEPNTPYRYVKYLDDELIYFWAHFTGSGARDALAECHLQTGKYYFAGVSDDISDCFRRLFRCFILRGTCYEMDAVGQLVSIFAKIRDSVDSVSDATGLYANSRVGVSLEYISRHYSENITLSELARMENLSQSRYSAVFRACIGQSPQNYTIALRMQNAKELMRKTNLSVKEIALSVGYGDQLYFSRLFRKKEGISPRAYKSTL